MVSTDISTGSDIVLSDEQQRALDRAVAGDNIFISGPGGVGKSVAIRRIIEALRAQGKEVAVTASTGIAALQVGGSTIHSYLGTRIFGNWLELEKAMIRGAIDLDGKQAHLLQRMLETEVIVVDEISMLTGDYLTMMDKWLRYTRQEGDLPFGGVQVIFSGDFLQLAPVVKSSDQPEYLQAFTAPIWQEAGIQMEMLSKCFRQEDEELIFHLMNIRVGNTNQNTIAYFNQFLNAAQNWQEEPTWLLTHNDKVMEINLQHLGKLPGKQRTFEAFYSGRDNFIDMLRKNCIADEVLRLKKDALVMIIRNDHEGGAYMNGTRAHVVGIIPDRSVTVRVGSGDDEFTTTLGKHTWEFLNHSGRQLASMKQIPLKLAYAITIHKSQGMTLDNVHTNLYECFAEGQAYTALSRIRSVRGLSLEEPLTGYEVHTDAKAVKFYLEQGEA